MKNDPIETSRENIPFEVTNDGKEDTSNDLKLSIDDNYQLEDRQTDETDLQEMSQTSIEKVLSEIQLLKHDFEAKLKYDAHKEATIDKLHNELQSYKNDIIAKAVKPILMDIIIIIDDNLALIERNKEKMETSNEGDLKKIFNLWQGKVDDLTEVLNRSGAEVYECPEDDYVPNRQKAIKAITTENPKLDKKICRRLKRGYEWEGKILRHEQVTVYKYKPTEENE